MIYNVYPFTDH